MAARNDRNEKPAITSVVSGVGNWSYCPVKKLFSASRECCQLRGLGSPDDSLEFDSDVWWQRVQQFDLQRLKKKLDQLHCASMDQISIRYRIQGNDDQWRWILTRACVNRCAVEHKLMSISGMDIDVTEIYEDHSDNKLLRDEAKRFETALASADQGLWHIDYRLGIRIESDTWRTMRGYPADSNYSSRDGWYSDIHPDDVWLLTSYERDEKNNGVVDYAYRQRHATGEWRWIWSRGKVIEYDDDGQPLVITGTDTDITQIKEAEARFERLSNTLEIAIQAAGMGVWEWTLNAQANILDRRTREMFGTDISTQYISRKQLMSLVHPDDRAKLDQVLNNAILEHNDISVDYRIIHKDKGVRHIKAQAKCLNAVGKSPRYVGIVWDITDTLKAEQERISLAENLSHALRLQSIGELTGGIAHDFNNLLAIISGNAELMAMTMHEETKYLQAIIAASERGAELVQGLFAFSRKQALTPVSVDMGELVNDLWLLLGRTLGPTITIDISVPDHLWRCEVDPVQMENALINLVVNARDAMPKGGPISIKLENKVIDGSFARLAQPVVPGDFVKVSVIDRGIGMSKEVVNKSMDPFFTTKATGDGHGLGLSMVFGFINQSNGHITIDSEEGNGTVVSLYLPRHSSSSQKPAIVDNRANHMPVGSGQAILLVEDESFVRDMIRGSMEFLGYNPICVSSAAEALDELTHSDIEIDLVVSDIVLADSINGVELGVELNKHFPLVKILYISGYAQDALREQGVENTSMCILQKPFSIESLAVHIAKLLPSSSGCEIH